MTLITKHPSNVGWGEERHHPSSYKPVFSHDFLPLWQQKEILVGQTGLAKHKCGQKESQTFLSPTKLKLQKACNAKTVKDSLPNTLQSKPVSDLVNISFSCPWIYNNWNLPEFTEIWIDLN